VAIVELSPVGGKVQAWANTLSLGPTRRIAGDLEYHSEHQADIPYGTVAGRVQFDQVQPEQRQAPLLNGLFVTKVHGRQPASHWKV
jgi:hypothetical protein